MRINHGGDVRKIAIIVSLAVLSLALSGCLGFEKKQYRYTLNPDGSGSGVIRFINIVSIDENSGTEDAKDVSFKDFATLVSDHLEGTEFENGHPGLVVTEKKLYEENGALVAEVKFTFTSFDSIGFFRKPKCDCCPILYFNTSGENDEKIAETNGKLVEGVASSPFIEWDGGVREFTFQTTALNDLSGTRPLIDYYRTWKAKK
jgi:hypothetical protein